MSLKRIATTLFIREIAKGSIYEGLLTAGQATLHFVFCFLTPIPERPLNPLNPDKSIFIIIEKDGIALSLTREENYSFMMLLLDDIIQFYGNDSVKSITFSKDKSIDELRFELTTLAEPPALLITNGLFSTANAAWEWKAETENWQPAFHFAQTFYG